MNEVRLESWPLRGLMSPRVGRSIADLGCYYSVFENVCFRDVNGRVE